jgi:hypothetical protein
LVTGSAGWLAATRFSKKQPGVNVGLVLRDQDCISGANQLRALCHCQKLRTHFIDVVTACADTRMSISIISGQAVQSVM